MNMNNRMASAAVGMAQANEVKIEMAEQLTGTKKKAAKAAAHPKKDKDKEDSVPKDTDGVPPLVPDAAAPK
jgi:hypothetical protein